MMIKRRDKKKFAADAAKRVSSRLDAGRVDDAYATIYEKLVTMTMPQLEQTVYKDTLWGSEVLMDFDEQSVPPGIKNVDWHRVIDVDMDDDGFVADRGEPKFVEIKTERDTARIAKMQHGYAVDIDELEAWAAQGFGSSLPDEKAAAARRKWARNVDTWIRTGKTGVATGVTNQPGIHQLVAGTTTGTTAAWSTAATPSQVVQTFDTMVSAIETSNPRSTFNTVVFPRSVGASLRRKHDTGSPETILEWLKAQFPQIDMWVFDPRETSGVLLYDRTPEAITIWMPKRMDPLDEFVKHGRIEQVMDTLLSPVIVKQPKSFAYCSGVVG